MRTTPWHSAHNMYEEALHVSALQASQVRTHSDSAHTHHDGVLVALHLPQHRRERREDAAEAATAALLDQVAH